MTSNNSNVIAIELLVMKAVILIKLIRSRLKYTQVNSSISF